MTLTLSPIAVYVARCAAPVAGLALWEWGDALGLRVPVGIYLGLTAVLALTNLGELRARLAAREPAVVAPGRLIRSPDLWAGLLTVAISGGGRLLLAARFSSPTPPMIAGAFLGGMLILGSGFGRKTTPSTPYVSYRWRGSAVERAWRRVRGRVRQGQGPIS